MKIRILCSILLILLVLACTTMPETQIEDLGFAGGGENIIVSGLQAYTASLKSVAIISGSQQITDFGFVSESSTTIPQGTISGSQQITDLGFISGAAAGAITLYILNK